MPPAVQRKGEGGGGNPSDEPSEVSPPYCWLLYT